MKKYYFLLFIVACFIGVNAQDTPSGHWGIVNGVSVFIETGSYLDMRKPGVPNHNPNSTSYRTGVTLINFDDVTAPCLFVETSPLSTEYASQGVTFSGSGFYLLNECSSFSVSGYSKPNHLAWSEFFASSLSEEITFTQAVSNVSFLAGSDDPSTLTAEAFDETNQSLGIVNVTINNVMQTIDLPFSGIVKVTINTQNYGIMDDLKFESFSPHSVPLSNWALYLGIMLMLAFTVIRLKRIM